MSQNRLEVDVHRLGHRELGRYAFEEQMPTRIAGVVAEESCQNKSTGIIKILAALLQRDRSIETAHLCHDSAVQISKLRGEGRTFCGYRTIQMLLPNEHPIYSVPQLQVMIEDAWQQGYNSHGRIETGGIRGTRKLIGTSEAQALFQSLGIPCQARIFSGKGAWRELLDSIDKHFVTLSEKQIQMSGPVCITSSAPVFLSRPSHSLAIVGIERRHDGKRCLLVFDSAYKPMPIFLGERASSKTSPIMGRLLLYSYRRDERYLRRFSAFETLTLTDPRTSTSDLPRRVEVKSSGLPL